MNASNPNSIGANCYDSFPLGRRPRSRQTSSDLFRGEIPLRAPASSHRPDTRPSGTITDLCREDSVERRHIRPRPDPAAQYGAAGRPSWLDDAPRGIRVHYHNNETSVERPIISGRRPGTRSAERDPVLDGEAPPPVRPRAQGAWTSGRSDTFEIHPGERKGPSRRPEHAPIPGIGVFTGAERAEHRRAVSARANASDVGALCNHQMYRRAGVIQQENVSPDLLAAAADAAAAEQRAERELARRHATTAQVSMVGGHASSSRVGEIDTGDTWSSMYRATMCNKQPWQPRTLE